MSATSAVLPLGEWPSSITYGGTMYSKPSIQRFGTFRELTQNTSATGTTDGAFHDTPVVSSVR